ncbi:MAG: T9SS type A sorting domain-containing protein [candidate division Zixibacteria bacterium]|nr:T9SS type A sorting domain-containing protein [candidate division Zixibacteria bacterium]
MYRKLKAAIIVCAIFSMLTVAAQAESIYEVQYSTNQGGEDDCYPSPFVGSNVTIEGVVTCILQGSYPDFFLQNPDSTTWNGIYIYDIAVDPAIGDYVSLTAQVTEYFGLTEIQDISDFQIVSHNNALPETLLISTEDLAGGCNIHGESYESVIVRVQNAMVTSDAGYGAHWIYDGSGDSCKIDDELYKYGDDQPEIAIGSYYDIVGIVMWNYDEYKINPRFADDVRPAGGANPPVVLHSYPVDREHLLVQFNMEVEETSAEETDNYSISDGISVTAAERNNSDYSQVTLTTSTQTDGDEYTLTVMDVESMEGEVMEDPHISNFWGGYTPIAVIQQPISSENDSSRLCGDYVTVKAVVTSDTIDFSRYYFYMQDESYIYYNGIKSFNSFFQDPQRGDTVVVTGIVTEYFMETELDHLVKYDVIGHGDELDPRVTNTEDLTQGSPRAEWYEGVLVNCNGPVTVTQLPDEFGNWKVRSSDYEDTIYVYRFGPEYDPQLDDILSLSGVFSYSFDEYKIIPRDDDISPFIDVGDENGIIPIDFRLVQNYPNPFNASTGIEYQIPEKSEVNLSVYNVMGQIIKSYSEGTKKPGRHVLNISMADYPSGIYFYRLDAGKHSDVKKMVLLK